MQEAPRSAAEAPHARQGAQVNALDWLSASLCVSQIDVERELDTIEPLAGSKLRLRSALDQDTPCGFPAQTVTRWQTLEDLSIRFYEVEQSLECLANVPVYMRRFPYRSSGISRSAYLQYHYENWLNETYILETRFVRFAGHIKKAFARDPLAREVSLAADAGTQIIKGGLAAAKEVRGEHVHETRTFDRDILMLGTWERSKVRNPAFPYDVEKEFRRVRRAKAAELTELNALIFETVLAACGPLKDELVIENERWPVFRTPASTPV